jgi:hypothetical protein
MLNRKMNTSLRPVQAVCLYRVQWKNNVDIIKNKKYNHEK